jgi:hypothetical protein
MMWFMFKLKSTNFVIVIAPDAATAKEKFKASWPKEKVRVAEKGDRLADIPDGAVEVLQVR